MACLIQVADNSRVGLGVLDYAHTRQVLCFNLVVVVNLAVPVIWHTARFIIISVVQTFSKEGG